MKSDLTLIPKKDTDKEIFHFDIFDGDENIGNLYLGTRVDEMGYLPVGIATNIFYEIKEEYKKRGYGRKIFSLALKEAKRVKKNKIIISYVGSSEDDEEEHVEKIDLDEKNASISDVSVITKEDGTIYHRYNINLN